MAVDVILVFWPLSVFYYFHNYFHFTMIMKVIVEVIVIVLEFLFYLCQLSFVCIMHQSYCLPAFILKEGVLILLYIMPGIS